MKLRTLIVLLAVSLMPVAAANAQGGVARGEKLYEECRACHLTETGAPGVGPSLRGVFGRRAGALEDFRFSPALKRSGITWNAQTLDAYVADPQKLVPANRMPYAGMPEARDRADLIEYMEKAFR